MSFAKIIVVSNQKGGCGKSSISVHLASGLTNYNFNVLLIDGDFQNTTTNWARTKEEFFFSLITLDEEKINKLLEEEKKNYQFIIIDCPPSFNSSITIDSLLKADLVIIPLLCSANDLWSLQKIINTIDKVKKKNTNLISYILINKYKPREILTREILSAIFQNFSVPVFLTKIGSRKSFRESAAYGKNIYNLKDIKAKKEINNLTEEVIRILKKNEKKTK